MDQRSRPRALQDTIPATISAPLQARLDPFSTKARALRSELTTL